jgi:thiamine pyrophosphate-dependent acetolactate synthase large subunit-like protein
MNGAQAFVEALRRNHTKIVFGIPGVHTLPLYNALYDAPDIRPVIPHHESGASFAADGYARVTGRPAVCVSVPGPGATNMSTGVGVAYADCVPMVVVTSQIPRELLGRAAVHDCDIESIYRPIVKACLRAESPDEVGPAVDRAFALALEGRPGPVQIMLWVDALSREMDHVESIDIEPSDLHRGRGDRASVRPSLTPESRARAEIAAHIINQSQNLAIVVGDGAVESGAHTLLRDLAERRGAVIATSISARGALPEDDPSCMGPLSWESVPRVLSTADACLAVGTRFSEISTLAWTLAIPQPLVRIDIDPEQLQKNYPAEVPIAGDAYTVMESILSLVETNEQQTRIRSVNSEVQSKHAADRKTVLATGSDSPLHPRWVTATIRDVMSDDTVFASDGTATQFWLTEPSFPIRRLNGFLVPEVSQTMGFGLGASIGARLGTETNPVVCITGDGSLMMTISEFATAVDIQAPLIVVVFDDAHYNALRIYQDGLYDGRLIGVKLNNPDFVALARAMGAEAVRVTEPGDLAPALRWALGNAGVTLVDVVVDHRPMPSRYERRVRQMREE